jgi:hypothetical protein
MSLEDVIGRGRAQRSLFLQVPEMESQHSLSFVSLLGVARDIVQLSRPFIKKLFTESDVIYGVESDLNVFSPRSQIISWDCEIWSRWQVWIILG